LDHDLAPIELMASAFDPTSALQAIDQPGDRAARDPHRLGDAPGRDWALLCEVLDGVEIGLVEAHLLGHRRAEQSIRVQRSGQRQGEALNPLTFSQTRHGDERSS
jgi:hypothetical protein